MNTDIFDVFLGSSLTLKEYRAMLGDLVRQIDDEWRSKGVRVRLKCCEDYPPEYAGVSKQEEYNMDLVKDSSMMLGLFRERIGNYTSMEIGVAVESGKPVKCICIPSENPAKAKHVEDTLISRGVDVIRVDDVNQMLSIARELINAELLKITPRFPLTDTGVSGKYVYATIASDIDKGDIPYVCSYSVGDLIRSVDAIVEETMGCRCILHPYNAPENICRSDYYMSFLNDNLTEFEFGEIQKAFQDVQKHHKPHFMTYICQGGCVKYNHEGLRHLLDDSDAFAREISSLDTVRFDLLLWFCRLRINLFTGVDNLFTIDDGAICFMQHRIADVGCLKDYGVSRAVKASLLKVVNSIINGIDSLPEIDASKRLDLDAMLNAQRIEMGAVEDMVNTQAKHLREDIDVLSARIRHLEICGESEVIEELVETRIALAKTLQLAVELNVEKPITLLKSYFALVFIYDSEKEHWPSEYDIDQVYGNIVTVADRYGVKKPQVEMMRLNYANSYFRENDYSNGLKMYRLALDNINQMDDASMVVRHLLCNLYTHTIHALMNLDTRSEALRLLMTEFRNKLDKWKCEDRESVVGECMYYAAKLRELPIRKPEADDMFIAEEAQRWMDKAFELNMVPPGDENFEDIYCYLPNNITTFYIDRLKCFGSQCYDTVLKYSHIQIENAALSRCPDVFLGMAYHNLGWFYYLQGSASWRKAYEHYMEAYVYRKRISHIDLLMAMNLAETEVNFCGLVFSAIENNMIRLSSVEPWLIMADEAIAIYSRYLVPGEIEPETNYYKAVQLKGSLLYIMDKAGYIQDTERDGIRLMTEAWNWHLQHPDNNYRATFMAISGKILNAI